MQVPFTTFEAALRFVVAMTFKAFRCNAISESYQLNRQPLRHVHG